MYQTPLVRKICALVLSILLLATVASAAEEIHYTMTIRDGFVCVRDEENGQWIYCSQVHAESLSQRDQLLLETGIPLNTRAEFTSAVEDFCS